MDGGPKSRVVLLQALDFVSKPKSWFSACGAEKGYGRIISMLATQKRYLGSTLTPWMAHLAVGETVISEHFPIPSETSGHRYWLAD